MNSIFGMFLLNNVADSSGTVVCLIIKWFNLSLNITCLTLTAIMKETSHNVPQILKKSRTLNDIVDTKSHHLDKQIQKSLGLDHYCCD